MPQVKKLYGLVYNTDGSLCVTYRDDDVPFAGVRSFAVETATTNLVTDSPQQPPCFKQQDASFTRTIVTSGSLAGWVKINITNTGTYPAMIQFGLYSCPANETRTYAIDAILPDDMFLVAGGDAYLGSLRKISNTRYAGTFTPTKDGRYGIYIQSTLPKGTTGSWDVYVHNYQIEQKPFASSFVVGSRPDGLLKIRLDLDVNDAVVNFWFKIGSIFELDSQFGTRIIAFSGDIPTQNRFFIRADGYTNNATLKFYDSIDGVGPLLRRTVEDIDLVKWNMFTIVFDNGLIKTFLNENLLTQYTVSLNPIALKYLNIPEIQPGYLKTGFWSNLYFGKYRKPNGEIIWTDDYIREVYEAQIPFPVSNKLSIY